MYVHSMYMHNNKTKLIYIYITQVTMKVVIIHSSLWQTIPRDKKPLFLLAHSNHWGSCVDTAGDNPQHNKILEQARFQLLSFQVLSHSVFPGTYFGNFLPVFAVPHHNSKFLIGTGSLHHFPDAFLGWGCGFPRRPKIIYMYNLLHFIKI